MNNYISLNQSVMSDLEPSEGDDMNGNWISPFGVPKGIQIWNDDHGNMRCVKFEYSGGEIGDSWEPLDDRDDPPVRVCVARHTKKIIQVIFGHTINERDFPRIAERLNQKAKSIKAIEEKFNHVMISKIFENWNLVAERVD